MRLLLFNLATDTQDPILGFTTRWIEALAKRVAFIHVVTMRAGCVQVPANVCVSSVGKEHGYTEARRVVEFYRHLRSIVYEDRVDVCFAHMITIFTILGAPVLKARHIPIVSWYAHPSLTWTLKLAHHLSDHMVTSLRTAYPYRQDKLTVIGQGIDTDLFSSNGTTPEAPPVILAAGRLSPAKDHPTLLKAAALLRKRWGRPFRVAIVGAAAGASAHRYVASLHELTRTLELEDVVRFEDAVPQADLATWYRRSALHVNMTPTGFGDKVALEAMSCGRVCLVTNRGFVQTLGRHARDLVFDTHNPEDLAEKLQAVLELSPGARDQMGAYLREQVVRMHSLPRLVERLVKVLHDARA